ncbi:uncharacterized protein VTP21DRAFT_913 [Calcarisporiella thermophila]|uniref:uncharacterized protein n=1 Tax=Calcarisporiella thermophila TaxID=911321 RepID=UPI0037428AE9
MSADIVLHPSLNRILQPAQKQDLDRQLSLICSSFCDACPSERRFDALLSLYEVLIYRQNEKALLEDAARIAALYLLHDLYSEVPIYRNPFLTLFLDLLEGEGRVASSSASTDEADVEKRVLRVILGGEGSKLAAFSPTQILRNPEILPTPKQVDIERLEQSVANETEFLGLPDSSATGQAATDGIATQPVVENKASADESLDFQLMEKAIHSPLSIPQKQYLEQQFQQNDGFVFRTGLSPEWLPDLVTNNPDIAIQALLQLIRSPQATEYLQALLTIPLSLHLMEVVNCLTRACEVPREFLHLYLSNCMRTCERTEDRYMQNRQVRLVCVFIQSLLQHGIIDACRSEEDGYFLIEVQHFCIHFSRVREAAALFRLLVEVQKAAAANLGTGGNSSASGTGVSSAGTHFGSYEPPTAF